MTDTERVQSGLAFHPATLLCVDDEPNILSSLRRLFRVEGFRILTAENGEAGLAILRTEPVDLVISDMRMPEMSGARFLEHVRANWPDTVRLLLTGYADIQSVMTAINRGEIYRYITKPWDDNDILLVVRQALERRAVGLEKKRLEALTQHQNEELRELNARLEEKVEARTVALKRAHDALAASNDRLKTAFLTSIKVFSSLIEMRAGSLAGHSRRVAELARRIAMQMDLAPRETQDVFVAGLLHHIGKVGFPDELLSMPVSLMNGNQLGLYRKYPQRGEELLMPLDDLRGVAAVVRSHQERFDGEGFPDRLSGFNIPLGARILAVASDYDKVQTGIHAQRRLRPEEAAAFIAANAGKRYDPSVVNAFRQIDDPCSSLEAAPADALSPAGLRPGMVIARDLLSPDGFLLLSADHVLNERQIAQIMEFEAASGTSMTVYVQATGA